MLFYLFICFVVVFYFLFFSDFLFFFVFCFLLLLFDWLVSSFSPFYPTGVCVRFSGDWSFVLFFQPRLHADDDEVMLNVLRCQLTY